MAGYPLLMRRRYQHLVLVDKKSVADGLGFDGAGSVRKDCAFASP
jgi:hypothetical protein